MSNYERRNSNEIKLCSCGCGIEIKKYDKKGREKFYVKGHQRIGKPFSVCNVKNLPEGWREETKLCGCGCDETILKYDKQKREVKFKNGHQTKGKNHPMFGKEHSDETKAEYSKVRKGRVNPTHVRKQTKQRNVENWQDPEYREKMTEILRKNSEKINSDPKYKEKHSELMKEKWKEGIYDFKIGSELSEETRNKISKTRIELGIAKNQWKDEEYTRKIYEARALKPNNAELKLQSILDDLYPNEWKYVGDFSVIIGGKNPDFICINGKKLIVELFGNYWHQGEDPQERINVFKPYGYNTLVIWESELKNKNRTSKKIIHFVETN